MKVKEILKDALPVISNFAPSIAGAISGPVGLAAGYVLPLLADAFSVHPSNITGLASTILNDSGAQEKLEKIESDYGTLVNELIAGVNHLSKAEINVKLEWQAEQK